VVHQGPVGLRHLLLPPDVRGGEERRGHAQNVLADRARPPGGGVDVLQGVAARRERVPAAAPTGNHGDDRSLPAVLSHVLSVCLVCRGKGSQPVMWVGHMVSTLFLTQSAKW